MVASATTDFSQVSGNAPQATGPNSVADQHGRPKHASDIQIMTGAYSLNKNNESVIKEKIFNDSFLKENQDHFYALNSEARAGTSAAM